MAWAWRKRVCPGCGYLVAPGVKVFQLSRGTCVYPAITPTGGNLVGEWHDNHFHDYPLLPQAAPYECSVCKVAIADREQILYGAIGTKPVNPYARAEQRGYELYFVAHETCWERLQEGILARRLQEFGKQ